MGGGGGEKKKKSDSIILREGVLCNIPKPRGDRTRANDRALFASVVDVCARNCEKGGERVGRKKASFCFF